MHDDIENFYLYAAIVGHDDATMAAEESKFMGGRSHIKALASVQLAWH